MIPPIAASRSTAVATDSKPAEKPASPAAADSVINPRSWTLGDYLIAGFSVLSLIFAVVGVLIAIG